MTPQSHLPIQQNPDETPPTTNVASPASAHQQAMILVQQERSLRRLLRSLAWKQLKQADIRRLNRATDALESDMLLARILLRAAVGQRERHDDRAENLTFWRGDPQRRRTIHPQHLDWEDNEV